MATNFPAALDSYTTKQDNVDTVSAAHVNNLQDAVVALETKVGIDSSADTSSIDYLLKNTASVDPGHHHSSASIDSLDFSKLIFSGLTSGHALFATGTSSVEFRQIQESDIADGTIFPRRADIESISGFWTFSNMGPISMYTLPGGDWFLDFEASSPSAGIRIADSYQIGWNNANTLAAGFVDVNLWRSGTSTLRVGDGTQNFTGFGKLELKELRIYKDLAVSYCALTFNGTSTVTYVLPPNAGTSGQFLQTDGFGNLSWVTSSATVTLDGVQAAAASVTRDHGDNTITWRWNRTIIGPGLALEGGYDGPGVGLLSKMSAMPNSQITLLHIDGANITTFGWALEVRNRDSKFTNSPVEISVDSSGGSTTNYSTYPLTITANSANFRGIYIVNRSESPGAVAGVHLELGVTDYGEIGAYADTQALEIRGDDSETKPVYIRPGTTTTAKVYRNDSSSAPILTVEQQGSGDCLFTIKRGATEFFAGIDDAQNTDLIFGSGAAFLGGSQAQLRLEAGGSVSSYIIYDKTSGVWSQVASTIEANPSATSSAEFSALFGRGKSSAASVNSITALKGVFAESDHQSAATATYVIGLDAVGGTSGSSVGSVSNLIAIRGQVKNNGANMSVTNAYGLYLESPANTGTITNLWGVYQAGTEANYFRGPIRVGSTPAAPQSGVGLQYDGILALQDGITAPGSSISGYAQIYIDSADGDLKIRFSDGVVKTIVTDA